MDNKKIDGLNELFNYGIVNEIFPSANYCLVTKDNIYYNSFGYKTLYPDKEENNIDTLYDMASCTKVLCTTTCLMKLIEAGKLRLYDSVSMYLPRFIYTDVTIWDLMTHSSGLPADVHRSNTLKSKDELLDKIFSVEMKYPKNSNIVYSDIGFILLGMVVENISGKSLDVFSKETIFDPLEMFNTGFNPIDNPRFEVLRCAATEFRHDDIVDELLRGKVHDEKAYIMNGVAGHAGLFSCVKDIEHFITMVLNNGVYNGKQFLSQATIDLLFTPQVKTNNGVSLDTTIRGLGWIVRGDFCSGGDLVSPETIHHTGFTGTNVVIDRINKVGYTILTNRVHPTRANIKLIPYRAKIGNYIIANFGGRNEY